MIQKTTNAWLKNMPQIVGKKAQAVQPRIEAILPKMTGIPGLTMVRDHFYLVLPTREEHLKFLAGHVGEDNVLVAIDDFKEKDRILAASKLPKSIAGFPFIETGQPYSASPEDINIAHLAFCISGKDGAFLDSRQREEVQSSVLETLGLKDNDKRSELAIFGLRLSAIRRDVFGGRLTAVKFNLVGWGQIPSIELRFFPLQQTLGERQTSVLQAIRDYT